MSGTASSQQSSLALNVFSVTDRSRISEGKQLNSRGPSVKIDRSFRVLIAAQVPLIGGIVATTPRLGPANSSMVIPHGGTSPFMALKV